MGKAMTPAQLATLKTAIEADPAFASLPHNGDGAFAIAESFNATASPAFTAWKSNVSIGEIGKTIVATGLAALTTANTTRLGVIAQINPDGINPSRADQRAFFDDVFSASSGDSTRAALLVLWKRLARRVEKLFATGTGSDASPATLVWEGPIAYQDVLQAMGW